MPDARPLRRTRPRAGARRTRRVHRDASRPGRLLAADRRRTPHERAAGRRARPSTKGRITGHRVTASRDGSFPPGGSVRWRRAPHRRPLRGPVLGPSVRRAARGAAAHHGQERRSVMVHADPGGYKPSNWMTPPTVIEEEPRRASSCASARAPARIGWRSRSPRCSPTSRTTWARRPRWRRTASRPTSRRRWPRRPTFCGEGFRLVRREWPTDIGPVDLMCRDGEDDWIAVEIKRIGTIDAVEQLTRYLERIRRDPAMADCRGVLAAQTVKPQARVLAEARGIALRRGRSRGAARRARARADAVRERLERHGREAVATTSSQRVGSSRCRQWPPSRTTKRSGASAARTRLAVGAAQCGAGVQREAAGPVVGGEHESRDVHPGEQGGEVPAQRAVEGGDDRVAVGLLDAAYRALDVARVPARIGLALAGHRAGRGRAAPPPCRAR